MRPAYLDSLPAKLDAFQRFLGKRPWFAGDNITFVDFVMYELLDQHRYLAKNVMKMYKGIEAFLDRFEKLPNIEDYMKSSR
jgi:glutathione S-transferase